MARWFGPKKFGYGVGPRAWQGWAASLVFAALLIAVRLTKPETFGYPHWLRHVVMTAVIVLFGVVIYLKYERDPPNQTHPGGQ